MAPATRWCVIRQKLTEIVVETSGREMVAITPEVCDWVKKSGIDAGLLTLQIRHTSASLMLQENYDPDVQRDMEQFLRGLVPDGDPRYLHSSEGPDDMPAHIRAALTTTTISLPVQGGRPTLGSWQAIYLYEHRTRGHRRTVAVHLIGE